MITEKDQQQLANKGVSLEQVKAQLHNFKTGFPFLEIESAATVTNGGILRLPIEVQEAYVAAWENWKQEHQDADIVKFVPASGAASRMFKDLYAFLEADYEQPQTSSEKTFFDNIDKAPFFELLNQALLTKTAKSLHETLAVGEYKAVLRTLLLPEGLSYGSLPKGLLQFHRYATKVRTAFEEHWVEGLQYAQKSDGSLQLHFTVSSDHRALFEQLTKSLQEKYGSQIIVSFSEQLSATDTIAVNIDNSPFRNADGTLLFRPGGHGALIENLNAISADIIFVKNIDNIVPEEQHPLIAAYKKILAGVLVSLQRQIFQYLEMLDEGNASSEQLDNMLYFLENQLGCRHAAARALEGLELMDYLYCKFNRPLRVCGMVRNTGEPGGGPFFAYNNDGSCSLQILESSQIDMQDEQAKAHFENGTHFNPVDLVCGVKDYLGEKFDLTAYVDPATGFISEKSKDGRVLKAQELPGLWNGAMSDWNTVFVEVSANTFHPVKEVNDLYREIHQAQ